MTTARRSVLAGLLLGFCCGVLIPSLLLHIAASALQARPPPPATTTTTAEACKGAPAVVPPLPRVRPVPVPPRGARASVFIGVLSCVPCLERRNTLRESWLSGVPRAFGGGAFEQQARRSFGDGVFVRYAFLVAHRYNESALEARVDKEAEEQGDIVRFDIVDGRGMPMAGKTREYIMWIGPVNYTWVVKTDDDVYVNVGRLITKLLSMPSYNRTYYGYLFGGTTWADRMEEMYEHPYYGKKCGSAPPYMSGSLYALSGDVVWTFSLVAMDFMIVGHEDTTVGLWALALYHLNYVSDHRQLHPFRPGERDIICSDDVRPATPPTTHTTKVISQHYLTHKEIRSLWAHEQRGTPYCLDNVTFNVLDI
eukprot:TRINITY_DN4048_c0_g1_i1.p1 TRINITY_DN4048_c0_g1~~TRINITY_DN4048_c0_g1_i1.p1  ORF type:complete len:366 (+),score=93.33 TRINITY_DN4048_c0_g1_i1:35-1132(+)